MHRRTIVAGLMLTALPGWQGRAVGGIGEVRVGGTRREAAGVRRSTGIAVRVCEATAEALNEGHLEAAYLDRAGLARARALMGGRLTVLANGVATRTVLPEPLLAALARA